MKKFLLALEEEQREVLSQLIDYIEVEYPKAIVLNDDLDGLSYSCSESTIAFEVVEDSYAIYFDDALALARISENYPNATVFKDHVVFNFAIPMPYILICSAIDVSFDE